jgi:hypothetical protein
MMPCGVVKNTVMELGIESIILRTDKKLKKVVMPLRVAVRLTKTNFFWLFTHVDEKKLHFKIGTISPHI